MECLGLRCAAAVRVPGLARGRIGPVLLIAPIFWLAGCVSVQPRSVDAQASHQLDGHSVTYVTRAKPSFSAMTPTKAAFAIVGAAAAISEGNSIIESNAIADPADDISNGLMQLLERTNGMTPKRPAVSAPSEDAEPIAEAARARAEYVLDVRTINWSFLYFPTNWTHYRVIYTARARLIDARSGKVVAEAACKQIPGREDGAPTYDELAGDNFALLKRKLSDYGASCIESLGSAMFPQQRLAEQVRAQVVEGAPAAVGAAPSSNDGVPSAPRKTEQTATATPSQRPINAVALDAADLAGKTWRYAHREERFAFVELAFKPEGRIEARNKLSRTTGRYDVHGDMLCATYNSPGWGQNCYYVIDDGSDALKLQSLSIQRMVGFEVCTEASCKPATRANLFQPVPY